MKAFSFSSLPTVVVIALVLTIVYFIADQSVSQAQGRDRDLKALLAGYQGKYLGPSKEKLLKEVNSDYLIIEIFGEKKPYNPNRKEIVLTAREVVPLHSIKSISLPLSPPSGEVAELYISYEK